MSDFQTGAGEEIRFVLTGQYDTTTAADFQAIVHTGSPTGPSMPRSRAQTDEVNPTLQVNDNPSREFTVECTVQGLWRSRLFDLPLQMVMGNLWAPAVSITGTDISSTSAAGVNKLQSATADKFLALATLVPCPVWVKRAGASPLAHYAIALAVQDSNTTLVLGKGTASGADPSDGVFGVNVGTVAIGDNVTVMNSGVLKNGALELFAMIERAQPGLGHYYAGFGMFMTQCDLTFAKGSDPTWNATWAGKTADNGTATYGTGIVTPAPTFPVFNCGQELKSFGLGGVYATKDTNPVSAFFPTTIDLSIASAGNPVNPMGCDGPFAHTKDTVIVTGSTNLLSNNAARTFAKRQYTDEDGSIAWANQKTHKGVTESYFHWVPRIQFDTSAQEGGGNGSTVSTALSWMAAKHETYGMTYGIGRFYNLPL